MKVKEKSEKASLKLDNQNMKIINKIFFLNADVSAMLQTKKPESLK